METNWNEINLAMPSLKTTPSSNTAFVSQLRLIIRKNQSQNKILQNDIRNNAALLSRLMARRKNSFNSMYGFKCVCKVNAALSRLLKVDLDKALNNLLQMLPEITNIGSNELPTQNFYDYTLLKIIAIHKLYSRISFYCMESVEYFHKVLTNNFFLETNILFIANLSKLWSLSNKLGNSYVGFYKKLFQYRNCFSQTKVIIDHMNFELPKQLEYFSKDIKVDRTEQTIQNLPETTFTITSNSIEDIGMAVQRDSLKPVIDLSRVHNIDDVRRYFKEENENRKNSPSTCATKYVLKHEWLNVQRVIQRKIIANDHKKALSIFRKFITSKM